MINAPGSLPGAQLRLSDGDTNRLTTPVRARPDESLQEFRLQGQPLLRQERWSPPQRSSKFSDAEFTQ